MNSSSDESDDGALGNEMAAELIWITYMVVDL